MRPKPLAPKTTPGEDVSSCRVEAEVEDDGLMGDGVGAWIILEDGLIISTSARPLTLFKVAAFDGELFCWESRSVTPTSAVATSAATAAALTANRENAVGVNL